MRRYLRSFGGALVAVLAVSAMAASAAQAVPQFTAEAYPATIDGQQVGAFVLKDSGGEFSCSEGTYTGALEKASSTLTLNAQYASCAWSGLSATIFMNGCSYVFHLKEKTGNDTYKGPFDISCPAGKVIEVNAYTSKSHTVLVCRVTIGSQTGLGPAVFVNITAENDDEIPEATEGLKYTQEGVCTNGEFNTGIIQGAALFTAKNELGEPIGLGVSGE